MNIIHWNPFRELEDMSDRLNRIFNRSSPSRLGDGNQELTIPDWSPAVDIAETKNDYQIKMELPEVKKEDVKVSLADGRLCIKGERKLEKEEKDKKFHRVERFYGSFMRSFVLPENIDESKLKADFKDGVLNICIPKSEKTKAKSTEIKID